MIVGGETQIVNQIVNSAKPVCGVTRGAGGGVGKSMLRTHKQTDTQKGCSTFPARSRRFERKTKRDEEVRSCCAT